MGGILVAISLPGVVAPASTRKAVAAFPRHRIAAWVLTAVDLAWVTWIIANASLGRFEFLKPALYLAAPLSYALIVVFMDELLAPRALGGLFLLAANPMLQAARWHASGWRFVIVVLAYAWVVIGVTLVLSPYRFRQVAHWPYATDGLCRLVSAGRAAFGAFLLFLGTWAF
ncbi:MAG: hypothetical protein PHT59_07735 [Candidatus Omnitrophica bacterium]|nr:hypothetical protein [Candidatus Omnitrophota bacterium]